MRPLPLGTGVLLLAAATALAGGPARAQTTPPDPLDPTLPPLLASFQFTPKILHPGDKGEFRFVTSRSGAATITLDRQVAGRAVGGRCVAPTAANATAPACLKAVPSGRLRSAVDAGEGLRRFDGTVNGHRLTAGRYRATLRVVSAEVGSSAPAYATVRIAAR